MFVRLYDYISVCNKLRHMSQRRSRSKRLKTPPHLNIAGGMGMHYDTVVCSTTWNLLYNTKKPPVLVGGRAGLFDCEALGLGMATSAKVSERRDSRGQREQAQKRGEQG